MAGRRVRDNREEGHPRQGKGGHDGERRSGLEEGWGQGGAGKGNGHDRMVGAVTAGWQDDGVVR